MKKSKILSLLTAGALCMTTMLPMSVFAATPNSPYVASATIANVESVSDANGNLYLTVPSDLQLAGKKFELTTSEAVSFVATSEAAAGQLYAAEGSATSATLRFNINVLGYDLNSDDYSINLTSDNGTEWSGTFNENFDATMSILGQGLNISNATLREKTIVNNADTGNATWNIYTNSDASNTQLVICDPASDLVKVTYVYGTGENEKYEWNLPEGAPLPQVVIPGPQHLDGWYMDSNYTTEVDFETATVSEATEDGGMTVYAKTSAPTSGEFFLNDLADENATVLHIGSPADFNDFVNHSTEVDPDQLVVLTTSIDLNNASYQAIQFEGNFDGRGNTISNGTFTSNGNYAGMFSELGATQKIANLNLDDITVEGGMLNTSNFSGVLAGQVYGVNETPRENCLIQNVHVTNSSVSGYTSGGLVGYSFASMIRYCSVEDTSVTGLANEAGIAGLTYGDIDACYSDGLSLFFLSPGAKGGIAGKILESGNVTNCWYSYAGNQGPAGEIIGGNASNYVSTSSSSLNWTIWASKQTVWTVNGQSASFISQAIKYDFNA